MADWQRYQSVAGVDDLVMLQTLTEKAISENLRDRLAKEQIYTYIGNVLISVNPFTKIRDMYSESRIKYYKNNSRSSTNPHIFALAANIFTNMTSEEENQCVIISGESGAGKTEASKQIMNYIAQVAPKSDDMDRVKMVMLESNPILEAFGNAKTVRNDNSSRFGKFMEIYFDSHGGPSGGHVRNFLLEKSRVTFQGKGDRTFHIFYQLCCGADAGLRKQLKLGDPSQHTFCKTGGELERPGVSDAEEFRETCEAMDKMGISKSDRDSIFRQVAAILHLGDVTFIEQGDHCVAENRTALQTASDLLEVDIAILERAFTWKLLEIKPGEAVDVQLDLQQCKEVRDALCKSLYSKIFDWVVAQVNKAFDTKDKTLMIGILDIYGFEIFEKNGFEQFCINYVNEKLQQIFIELTLKVEQEEYVREKIHWETIKYFNNKIVCDLVEGKSPSGLFALMDDVCAKMHKEKASVADVKMLEEFDKNFQQHAHYTRMSTGFRIRHYAGDVVYSSFGFTQKNKDILPRDLLKVVTSSDDKLIRKFYSEEADAIEEEASGPRRGGSHRSTAGSKIRQQAAELVATLKKCTPHYIRCVKPNDTRSPLGFVDERVTHQVKYLGLLENVRVRRAGFSYRQHFDKFLKRFKYICPQTFPRPFRGNDKTASQTILQFVTTLPPETWQLGESKVFIRQPANLFHLEDLRESAFSKIAMKVQKGWKVYKGHREMLVTKQALATKMQQANKKRRPGSVFRVWKGDYLDYHDKIKHKNLHQIVNYVNPNGWQEVDAGNGTFYYYHAPTQATQWNQPPELLPCEPKILYTERLLRIGNHASAQQVYEYFILTDQAIFLIEDQHELVNPPPLEKPSKKNPNPPPMYPPYWIQNTVLKKKLPLQYLKQIGLTLQADNFLTLHFYDFPEQPLYQPPKPPVPEKPVKASKTAKKPVGKKSTKKGKAAAEPEPAPVPAATWEAPQPRVDCDPHEPVEDIILISQYKTEIVGLLSQAYRKYMQTDMPIVFSDAIDYVNKSENKGHAPMARQLLAYENWQVLEGAIYVQSENQLVAHCPSGLEFARIQGLEAEREKRRAKARERYQKEQEESKRKEEELEKQREEDRKRQVAERKRLKEAEERREQEEEEERERRREERKQRTAAVVASKSDKGGGGSPGWMSKGK
ncbi:Myosin ID heavy chain [Diplonema papillatum]|nr:Myosin ID heavy chain [Diplonema papillatum]